MRVHHKFKLFVLAILAMVSLFSSRAYAAGSAVISVESNSSVTAGGQVQLRFYVTPSGANVYDASIDVSLVNLTYVSYSSSGVGFNGYAGVPSGGSAGSTSFSLAVSYSGTNPGASGKSLMGTVTVQAAGSAGTGQVQLSGAQADSLSASNTPDPMTASSGGNKSITINAAQAPTCPSGQIGTPPNCTTPSSPPPPSTSNPNPNNPVDQPNSESTVNVGNESGDPNASPEVLNENEFALAASDIATDAGTDTPAAAKTSRFGKLVSLGFAGLLVLLALLAAKIILGRTARARRFSGASVSGTAVTSESSHHHESKHKDDSSGGPTIITPHK